MLSTRWRKVVRELWSNRTRTLLVVASIAVGIFAVGTVQQLRTVILTEMQAVYKASSAAHATVLTTDVDETMVDAVRRTPGIADAQGRAGVLVKVQVAPGQWKSLSVTAVEDFKDIRIDLLEPVYALDRRPEFGAAQTAWPEKDEIILERSSLDASGALPAGVTVGDTLLVETRDGKQRTLRVSGAAYDPSGFPATFTGTAVGYVSLDTLVRLGGSRTYDRVLLQMTGTPAQLLDKDYITTLAETVSDKIKKAGHPVQRVDVPDPGKLALQDLFDALALLLTPLGLLALVLSGFLVVNTISALMAQQVRQIGVMKAIGGQRGQIVGMYLGAVMIYSVAALAVALPLTVVVAGGIASFLGTFINIDFPRWVLSPTVIVIQVAIGLLVPLLAAVQPIRKGTAITVREAVSDYGAGNTTLNKGWTGRLLAAVPTFSRPLQLSLRNTFRRKGRLALTLVTMVLGGMLFMTVGSVRASLNGLIETGLDYYQFDVQLQFDRPYRIGQLEQTVRRSPGVDFVEAWGVTQAVRVRADDSESKPLTVTALPANSAMVKPTLDAGRWLLPEDANAIVLSQKVLADETDVAVGDTITLDINGKQSPWIVVGIARVLGGPPDQIQVYVNYPYYARLTNDIGRAASLQIKLAPDAGLKMEPFAAQLSERLEAEGYDIAQTFTIDTLRRFTGAFFDIVVYLLLSMGVLIASVGALGLMGTMSTNVLERTREIGVMRAIGATDGSVQQIVIVEGVLIGWISWLFGALLAFPVGALLATTVGQVLFQTTLPYTFSSGGLVSWLLIVTVLAAVASFLPAWNASRLTVREVLAYQ